MSKMDNLRAMREARYEAAQKLAKSAPAKPAAPDRPTSAPQPAATAAEALCGHRNMSGRTCTREHGHAAKSHRYS
ncbi:MAG: hypothetical protein CMJ44_17375 [Pimelobacter sp.]|nr:hypothetical protein [Pimelobacter sp.]